MSGTYNSYERDAADDRFDKTRPTYGGYSTPHHRRRGLRAAHPRVDPARPRRAAAVRGHHHLFAAEALRRQGRRQGRRGRAWADWGTWRSSWPRRWARRSPCSAPPNPSAPTRSRWARRTSPPPATAPCSRRSRSQFDFILDTVSAEHDYNAYLDLLKLDGTMVLLGIPEAPQAVSAGSLIRKRRRLAGSMIGGIAETQEMLDFCAAHGVASDIELIGIEPGQRGLRAHAEGGRALPLRDRCGEVGRSAGATT